MCHKATLALSKGSTARAGGMKLKLTTREKKGEEESGGGRGGGGAEKGGGGETKDNKDAGEDRT